MESERGSSGPEEKKNKISALSLFFSRVYLTLLSLIRELPERSELDSHSLFHLSC